MSGRQTEDVAFLKDSSKWPSWPLCPVRKRGKATMPDVGVVVDDGHMSTVYLANIWEIAEKAGKSTTLSALLQNAPTEQYESTEALIHAGWYVD